MIFYAAVWTMLGVGLGASLIDSSWFWPVECLVFLCILGFFFKHSQLMWIFCCVFIGFNYFHARETLLMHWKLPDTMIKRTMTIEGKIMGIPQKNQHNLIFSFLTDSLGARHVLIRLSWFQPYPTLHVNERWRLTVSLKPPTGLHNPGGFDYQAWLYTHGYKAVGYVKSQDPHELLQNSPKLSLDRWRESLQELITQSVKQKNATGLIVALTIGVQNLIQSEQWPVFQRTGTTHLIAIAGLHIGIVAGFGFMVMSFCWRRSSRLLLWRPAQYAQAVAAMIAAIFYGVMAGFSLPTQRAVTMVVIFMMSLLLKQEVLLWQRLVFAFCLIIFIDPFSFYSPSLWLSFGSVFWIAYVCAGRLRSYKKWQQWYRLQLALLIGLAPLTLYYFHQFSIVGFLANLIAVPWVGFIILPLCILAVFASLMYTPLAIALFKLAGICITPLWYYLVWLAQKNWAVFVGAVPYLWILGLSLLGAGLLLLPRGIPGRWFGVFCGLPLLFYHPPTPTQNQCWLTVLDVGQGLSVVLQTQHHVLLYDTGPKSYSGFDAGEAVILPYLHYIGVRKLDKMIISHGDNDHSGGAPAVLSALKTEQILTSIPSLFREEKALYCERGQHWIWEGVEFTVLWPLKGAPYADNNSSCVLKVSAENLSLLLTGDIEKPVEDELLRRNLGELTASILVAPHHGSKTSSTPAFIAAIGPKIVVFSTGAYNKFHFPSTLVADRYRKMHVKMYNTAFNGAVIVH